MSTLTKVALGMMGQLRPKPAKETRPPRSHCLRRNGMAVFH